MKKYLVFLFFASCIIGCKTGYYTLDFNRPSSIDSLALSSSSNALHASSELFFGPSLRSGKYKRVSEDFYRLLENNSVEPVCIAGIRFTLEENNRELQLNNYVFEATAIRHCFITHPNWNIVMNLVIGENKYSMTRLSGDLVEDWSATYGITLSNSDFNCGESTSFEYQYELLVYDMSIGHICGEFTIGLIEPEQIRFWCPDTLYSTTFQSEYSSIIHPQPLIGVDSEPDFGIHPSQIQDIQKDIVGDTVILTMLNNQEFNWRRGIIDFKDTIHIKSYSNESIIINSIHWYVEDMHEFPEEHIHVNYPDLPFTLARCGNMLDIDCSFSKFKDYHLYNSEDYYSYWIIIEGVSTGLNPERFKIRIRNSLNTNYRSG